jgi:hypothetical protein
MLYHTIFSDFSPLHTSRYFLLVAGWLAQLVVTNHPAIHQAKSHLVMAN